MKLSKQELEFIPRIFLHLADNNSPRGNVVFIRARTDRAQFVMYNEDFFLTTERPVSISEPWEAGFKVSYLSNLIEKTASRLELEPGKIGSDGQEFRWVSGRTMLPEAVVADWNHIEMHLSSARTEQARPVILANLQYLYSHLSLLGRSGREGDHRAVLLCSGHYIFSNGRIHAAIPAGCDDMDGLYLPGDLVKLLKRDGRNFLQVQLKYNSESTSAPIYTLKIADVDVHIMRQNYDVPNLLQSDLMDRRDKLPAVSCPLDQILRGIGRLPLFENRNYSVLKLHFGDGRLQLGKGGDYFSEIEVPAQVSEGMRGLTEVVYQRDLATVLKCIQGDSIQIRYDAENATVWLEDNLGYAKYAVSTAARNEVNYATQG